MNTEAEMNPQLPHAPQFQPNRGMDGVDTGGLPGLMGAILRNREQLLAQVFGGAGLNRLLGLMLAAVLALDFFYGFAMGIDSGIRQALSSACKIPLLYLLSLLVCFPVLYVINVLMGSRLGFRQTLALILVAFTLNAILLASFGPIVIFFTVTGADYHFLKLLHVAVMALGGLGAMIALYRGIVAQCEHSDVYPRHAVRILLVWMLIFGFVGTQTAWSLRPFLGAPELPFELFRHAGHPGQDNFYQAVWQSIRHL